MHKKWFLDFTGPVFLYTALNMKENCAERILPAMNDVEMEKFAEEFEAFGKFLDFLEDAMDERLRETEARRWRLAQIATGIKRDEKDEKILRGEKNTIWVEKERDPSILGK